MATFAFWNAERIGNPAPRTDNPAFKLGFFEATVRDILQTHRPTFMVCAEITNKGGELAQSLATQSWSQGYTFSFVPVVSPGNPCNFMVIHKSKPSVTFSGPYGTNVRRPYIIAQSSGGLRVAFAHLLSGGSEKTQDELLTFLSDLNGRAHALCGDINLDHATHFGSPKAPLGRDVASYGYATLATSGPTFLKDYIRTTKGVVTSKTSSKQFDYCIYDSALAPRISNIEYRYHSADHEVIDHAPVIYKIRIKDNMDEG